MKNLDSSYFYTERPEHIHPRQQEVAEYLFLHRPKEMHFQDPSGRTEAKWSDCTKHNLFVPLLDPNNEMNTLYAVPIFCFRWFFLTIEDTQLKFPASVGTAAKVLLAPKPDVVFGSHLKGGIFDDPVYTDSSPSVFCLDREKVQSFLSVQEFSDLSLGAIDDIFCFPTFAIERKSDSGSLYYAQNQLIGLFRCMIEAQAIAQRRISSFLPILAMGLVNVGNWVEFWAAWFGDEKQVIPVS